MRHALDLTATHDMKVQKWEIFIWLLIAILVLACFLVKAHYLDLLGRSFSN
jgi:hypothetical protein